MLKKIVSMLLAVSCLSVTALSGCGNANGGASSGAAATASSASDGGSASGKKFKIVVMPKQVGVPYFNDAENGVKKAASELGVDAQYTGPTNSDAAAQVKMLQDIISQGVDAIAVSANDKASLTPVLKKAKEKGILVLDWDSPADASVVDVSVQEIDWNQYAHATWDQLVKAMGTDEGDYAILTSTLSAESCNQWIKFGKEYAAKEYPKLHLVTDPIPTDEKQQEAYTKTLDLIKTYPTLKGIIGFSSPAPLGAAQAIQEKKLQDKISVVGSSLPNDSKKYLKDGSEDAALLWEPSKLGYLTVYLAKMKLEHKEITDGLDVPGVGKITVDGKNVVMGPPTVFTKENVDNFNF